MKRFKKIIGVMLSVITVLPYFSSLSFAQNEDRKIIQYNMIVEADGRNTHWEDENGNTVDFTQSELPSVKARARSNYYVPAKIRRPRRGNYNLRKGTGGSTAPAGRSPQHHALKHRL